jgi:hypothetical protein
MYILHFAICLQCIAVRLALKEQITNPFMDIHVFGLQLHIRMQIHKSLICIAKQKQTFRSLNVCRGIVLVETCTNREFVHSLDKIFRAGIS